MVKSTIADRPFAARTLHPLPMTTVDGSLGVGPPALFALLWLYGGYLVLFLATLWSTYQRPAAVSSHLRIVALITCGVVTLHVGVKIAFFFVSMPENAYSFFFMFPNGLAHITPCITGLLSDGLLAWRCYVLWGSRRWLKWALTFMVCADAFLGLSSNFAYGHYLNLLFQRKGEDQLRPLECLATALLLAWVWVFFAINTVMTTSIIGKIAHVTLRNRQHNHTRETSSAFSVVIRAVIESSLVSWIGLLGYGITTLRSRPASPSQDAWGEASTAMLTLLPVILGISQCLIIARVGLARFVGATSIRVPMRPSAVEMTARGQQQLHCITDVNTALSIKFAHAATEDVDVEHASASSMT